MPKKLPGSQMLIRGSVLIAALLLGMALAMRWQGGAFQLQAGTVLLVALGFTLFAVLVWGATLQMRRLESDGRTGESYDALLETAPGGILVSDERHHPEGQRAASSCSATAG